MECSVCSQSGSCAYTVNLHSSITITCENIASSDVGLVEFIWTKDNLPLIEDEYSIAQITPDLAILRFEIDIADSGSYECLIQFPEISEGTDKQTDGQTHTHRIRVLIYRSTSTNLCLLD